MKTLQDERDQATQQLEQYRQEIIKLTEQIKIDTNKIQELNDLIKPLTKEVKKYKMAFEASKSLLARTLLNNETLIEKPTPPIDKT